MTAGLIILAMIFLWGTVSARLTRADLTAPIVFVAVGALLGALQFIDARSAPETFTPLVEITLVWILFSDAARIPVHKLRHDLGLYVRLLAIGLPLTVLAGWALAIWLFPSVSLWLALLVAAALAPTDAALGIPVVTNPIVPARVRRLITVESGLNDGIATPVVMLAIAGAASAEGLTEAPGLWDALAELAIGALVGGVVGIVGGGLLRYARRAGWTAEEFTGIAVLALALAAYETALLLHGNGFVAAFCGGMAFGAAAGRRAPAELAFLNQAGSLVSLLVWLAFGAIAVPIMFDRIDLRTVLYAVLSLTLVRMVPVALASLGSGLDRDTVLFVGWFGPRGLASLVFALLALEALGPDANEAVAVIGLTVLMSVLAHGFSAAPLAGRYGNAAAARAPEPEAKSGDPVTDIPVRGLPRRPGAWSAATTTRTPGAPNHPCRMRTTAVGEARLRPFGSVGVAEDAMTERFTADETLDERAPASNWTGWVAFGAGMLIFIGAVHALEGFTTLLDHDYSMVTSDRLAVDISLTTLGWLQLLLGLLSVAIGLGAMRGNRGALVAAVIIAGISAITHLTFIAAYPAWSLLVIAFDVIVIYAIVAHGRDMRLLR